MGHWIKYYFLKNIIILVLKVGKLSLRKDKQFSIVFIIFNTCGEIEAWKHKITSQCWAFMQSPQKNATF